jgi:hypothetical protein
MASNPSPETAPESGAALWLAVGRLQSDTARLIEGQGNLRADLAETNRRSDETNRRIDRLFYAIVGVGAGVIGTLVAVLMRSG